MQITKFKILLVIILLSIMYSGELFAIEGSDSLLVSQSDSTSITVSDSTSIESLDSTNIAGLDSLGIPDSLATAIKPGYELTPRELRKIIRDSIRDVKDSIRWEKPRILETPAIPDSMLYKRIITWNANPYFNNLTLIKLDTTFKEWHTDYPFLKEDINTTYLGTIGSATLNHNYFKQRSFDVAPYFSPYMTYSYSPQDLPFYNTKTAYTELGYWGTLFANREREETNIRLLHSQNVTPALNFTFLYQRFGAAGHLKKEETDNKTLIVSANYLGKRYVLNTGFIRNSIERQENGGVVESRMVTDTIFDTKMIDINLQEADTKLARNTFFINHSYGVPLRLKKNDSLAFGEGTTAYIGHYGEVSKYSKKYTDNIGLSDNIGRDFYNNKFYINPTMSADSMGTLNIDNRVFLKLQPWTGDAIVSRLEGGVGYQYLKYFNFQPNDFLLGNKDVVQNNLYFYAGVGGKFRKYFSWEGFGKYNLAGYSQNDVNIDAKATFSFFPFKNKNEEVNITALFSTELKRPGWYENNYYSNHYIWDNDFNKVSKTKIEGQIDIPKWKLSAFVGYSLIDNNVYYDTEGVIRQNANLTNVLSAYLKKDFKFWYLHFDHKVLFQLSSSPETLPLPLISTNFKYYIQFQVVKNVMTVQLGAEATYNTAYNAPAYNPALGTFQMQNKEKIGNNPYIDIFANFQWKEVTLFVKGLNITEGWPSGDTFSAYQYIKPKRGFKIGIYWPFHLK